MYEIEIQNGIGETLRFVNPAKISFDSKLMELGSAKFSLERYRKNIETGKTELNTEINAKTIKSWNRIRIYYADDKKLVWEGWLTSIEEKGVMIVFNCVDFWGYVERKKLVTNNATSTDIEYTDETIKYVLETEWAKVNALKDTGFSIECDILDTFSTKISEGQSFQQLLRQIVELGYEVEAIYPKIIIKEQVGRDLTGASGKNLYYSYEDKDTSNIFAPTSLKIRGEEKINYLVALGKNDEKVVVQDVSANEEMMIGTKNFEKFGGADLIAVANVFLNEVKNDNLVFEVIPKTTQFLPGDLLIGDLIPVSINREDDIFDVNDNFRITQINVSNQEYITDFTISKRKPLAYPTKTILDRIKRLEQQTY